MTATGQVIGSVPYLAPEQVSGEEAGPAADVYALGLVLIECVTGRRCYPGARVEATVARLHTSPAVPADVPDWMGDVLSAMTSRHAARRPTADTVVDALRSHDAEPVLAVTAPVDLAAMAGLAASTDPTGGRATVPTAGEPPAADATTRMDRTRCCRPARRRAAAAHGLLRPAASGGPSPPVCSPSPRRGGVDDRHAG